MTQVSIALSLVFGQKSGPIARTFPTERRGVSLSEHSGDMARVGPVDHIAAKKLAHK